MYARKRNIGKSLLFTLVFYNVAMMVVWMIQTAFGYIPHYGLSFVVTNAIAILMWLFQVLILE